MPKTKLTCARIVVYFKDGKVNVRNCKSPACYMEIKTTADGYDWPIALCKRHGTELDEKLKELRNNSVKHGQFFHIPAEVEERTE